MRLRLAVVLVLLAVAPAAAQSPPAPQIPRSDPDRTITDGSAQRKLDRARRRWRRARLHDYRFELDRVCFCARGGPVVMFVRGDRPVNAPATLRDVATVHRLHRRIQRAIDGKVAGLAVRYDRRGVPRRIGIDNIAYAIDDEVAYRVDRFWRGTKGRGGPDEPAPR